MDGKVEEVLDIFGHMVAKCGAAAVGARKQIRERRRGRGCRPRRTVSPERSSPSCSPRPWALHLSRRCSVTGRPPRGRSSQAALRLDLGIIGNAHPEALRKDRRHRIASVRPNCSPGQTRGPLAKGM